MYRLVIAVLILTFSSTAHADISLTEYNKCKAISNSLKRLLCYDDLNKTKVAGTPDVASAPSASASSREALSKIESATEIVKGGWRVRVDENPSDFTKNQATASIYATSSFPSNITPRLVLHCNSRNTRLYINWGTPVGDTSRYNIFIDNEKFASPRWNKSRNKLITFYPRSILGKVKQMLEANQYSIEIEQRDGPLLKAVFDITGIEEAVEPIRYICEW